MARDWKPRRFQVSGRFLFVSFSGEKHLLPFIHSSVR
jgi:hypothetical protein